MIQNSYNHQHALSLVRADYINTPGEHLALTLSYVDYNGKMFGLSTAKVALLPFEGLERITSLTAYPLIFHPRQSTVRRTLIMQGRRFESFIGRHFAEYKDIGLGATINGRRVIYHVRASLHIPLLTRSKANNSSLTDVSSLTQTPIAASTPPGSSVYNHSPLVSGIAPRQLAPLGPGLRAARAPLPTTPRITTTPLTTAATIPTKSPKSTKSTTKPAPAQSSKNSRMRNASSRTTSSRASP
jgi:hypothetical protein